MMFFTLSRALAGIFATTAGLCKRKSGRGAGLLGGFPRSQLRGARKPADQRIERGGSEEWLDQASSVGAAPREPDLGGRQKRAVRAEERPDGTAVAPPRVVVARDGAPVAHHQERRERQGFEECDPDVGGHAALTLGERAKPPAELVQQDEGHRRMRAFPRPIGRGREAFAPEEPVVQKEAHPEPEGVRRAARQTRRRPGYLLLGLVIVRPPGPQ